MDLALTLIGCWLHVDCMDKGEFIISMRVCNLVSSGKAKRAWLRSVAASFQARQAKWMLCESCTLLRW